MSLIKYILSFFVGAILAVIFIFLTVDNKSILQSIQTFSSMGIMFGAVIALITYHLHAKTKKEDDKIAKSKIKLDLALEFLEHAYETLTNNNVNRIPKNDRMLWLTCARQLLASKKFSEEITHDEHKYIYDEYEDYWQTKLSIFLEKHKNSLNKRYFAEKAEHAMLTSGDERMPLSEQSLAVIFRFVDWNEDREDKIINIDLFSDEEIKKHKLFGFTGLADHIQEFRDYRKSITTKKSIK